MTDLLVGATENLTMTSLEISILTWKEHSNVLKDIEKMFNDLEMGAESQVKYYFAEQSQTGEMKRYKLPKKLTLTLVSWYNAKLRESIIDRWLELEKPKTWMSLVLESIKFLETEIIKEKEKNLILEEKIEEDRPLVSFANTIAQTSESILVREFCKLLWDEWINIWQNKLYKWFRKNGYLMKNNEPFQHSLKYFSVSERVVKSVKWDILTNTTYINWSGQIFFLKKLREEYLINPQKTLQ